MIFMIFIKNIVGCSRSNTHPCAYKLCIYQNKIISYKNEDLSHPSCVFSCVGL